MDKAFKLLIPLIRATINGEKTDLSYSQEDFESVFKLAVKHDIAQIVSYAVIDNEEIAKTARKYMFDASYRDTKNTYTYGLACDILNKNKIQFVPLKGMILKDLYPESFMRTNCDIDILVHKSDFDKAVKVLSDGGFTQSGDLRFHDVSLLYDNTNLELHFSICEGINSIDSVLSRVWENTAPAENFKYLQTREFFVFHHIAHMAYHFLSGGCGIRPFIDLWIMQKNNYFDGQRVNEFCKEAGLCKFYEAVMQTVDFWFKNGEQTKTTERITDYVLKGGVYGNYGNKAAARTAKKGGKIKNLLSSAFPRYEYMKTPYPILGKYPILLPLCYVSRLFSNTFGKKSDKAIKKYRIIKKQDSGFVENVSELLKELELN